MKKEIKEKIENWEKEFTKWWDGHCRKIGGIVERGIAYQDTRDFFLYQIIQARQQREKEILEEIENLSFVIGENVIKTIKQKLKKGRQK